MTKEQLFIASGMFAGVGTAILFFQSVWVALGVVSIIAALHFQTLYQKLLESEYERSLTPDFKSLGKPIPGCGPIVGMARLNGQIIVARRNGGLYTYHEETETWEILKVRTDYSVEANT
jgi:hypothetical protein